LYFISLLFIFIHVVAYTFAYVCRTY